MSGELPTADAGQPGAGFAPVSVVIPCYRCAKTIRRAVASVAAQTLRPLEVILVDDASGDDTLAELESIAREHGDAWVRVIPLPANVGAGEARNAGWDAARGEFIAFLDADDAWHPRKVEIQYAFMRRHPEVALSGHLHRIRRSEAARHAEVGEVRETVISYRRLLLSNTFITPSAMIRRELPYRFAEGKRHMEDFLLWLTVAANGHRVVRLDAELAYIFKAPYGETGLSAELAAMEHAELDVYSRIRQQGQIGGAAHAILKTYSLAKFARRLVVARLLGHQGTMPWLFPLVYLSITHSITALLIVVGVFGDPALAADIAIVHAAAVATFHAFSANTRNLILSREPIVSVADILRARLVLVVPLGAAALLLSVSGADVSWTIAGLLVLRRCVEWFNDVQLCEAERDRNVGFATGFLALQAGLFAIAALGILTGWKHWDVALGIWAAAPVLVTWQLRRALVQGGPTRMPLQVMRNLLAHTGSTAISGLALYAFRLLVVLLLAKASAGELFTAIAIGSFIGTLFANVLGPSVELHQRHGAGALPRPIRLAVALNLAAGAAISAFALLMPADGAFAGKSAFFWLACGLSLVGGVVMVKAQQVRLRVLRTGDGRDVLGPDVLIHIGLLAFAPLAIGLVGQRGATTLYLINALLAYVFYKSSQMSLSARVTEYVRLVVAFFLVFPLFFQLSGRIYNALEPVVDSGGVLLSLPLPVSLLACFAGIILLGDYRRATRGFFFVFAFFAAMLLASVVTTADSLTQERGKLLLLIQFLLPAFGLILGQMMGSSPGRTVEKGLFWACATIMPAQLAITWLQGKISLTHSLYLFSVYQHWQYVPVVLATALLVALGGLRHEPGYGRWTLPMAGLSLVYALSAYSTLGTAIAGAGLAALAFAILRERFNLRRVLVLAGVVALIAGTLHLLTRTYEFQLKTTSLGEMREAVSVPCSGLPASYIARAVSAQGSACVVNSVPDYPLGYLIALQPHAAEAVDAFHVEGELRRGAVTIGLVKNNAWAVSRNVSTPGPFAVSVSGHSGPLEGIVAASLKPGEVLDLTIARVYWVTASGIARPLPTAADRGAEVLPEGWAEVLPTNLVERIGDWALFAKPVFSSAQAMLFGHPRPMDRAVRTSAHNYFLDLAYNFGVVALLPILGLIAYTVRLVWTHRRCVMADRALLYLAAMVLFLVLVDSSFKVTLRQPYPGLFAFFLWGLLLTRLRETAAEPAGSVPPDRRAG